MEVKKTGLQVTYTSPRAMEEKENQILKTLLSDLHKYVTYHTDIKECNFELPSTVQPGTPLANHYQQALDIYTQFKEIKSEIDSDGKQLLQLFSLILGDGGEYNIVTSGSSQGTTDVAHKLLDERKRQNKIFQRALSEIEKMKQREQANTVIKDEKVAKKKHKDLVKTIEETEKQINRLKEENATDKENLKIQQDLTKYIDAKWTTDRELLQSSLAKQEIAKTKMAQLQKAFDGEVSKSQFLTKQLYDLQRERDELLKRLSRLAGDMLKHENTNLTDLNDVDRLMKLSKAYSELYDNEWTDAFEELTGRGLKDNDAVAKLLDMLMVTYHKCGQITWERYRTLKSVVSTIDIVHVHPSVVAYSDTEVQGYDETLPPSDGQATKVRNGREEYLVLKVNNPNVYTNHATKETEPVYNRNKDVGCSPQTNEEHLTSQMTLSIEQEREIKDIWRTTTKAIKQDAVKHLYTVLLTRFDTPIKDLVSTSKYLTSCIDLCWKMGVQEKPMYLDIVAEKNGGSGLIFDLDKFRAYTMSGERVDFVVWPALFLHDGGQILVKGIAQGCNKSGS